MKLTNDERMLVNSELQRKGKNIGLAYVLLIFLGTLGIHRFYLDKKGSAIALLAMNIGGWATSWLLIGFVPLAVVWVWVIVDLFLIPGMVNEANDKMEEDIIRKIRL